MIVDPSKTFRPVALLTTTLLFVLCASPRFGAVRAEPPERSFTRVLDVHLGTGAQAVHWGPRRPAGVVAGGVRLDLFVHTGNHVRIWWQSEEGFPQRPDEILRLPADPGLVDFGDVSGDPGEDVVVLTRRGVFADEARRVASERSGGPGGIFGDRARASDPGGIFRRVSLARPRATGRGPGGPVPVPFSHFVTKLLRDIDGDGRPDLVVPRQRRYEIWFRRDTRFVPAAFLAADHDVDVDPGGPELINPLEFQVEVSELDFKDLNADRRTDIVVSKGQARLFYLQGQDGFSQAPSYELDLKGFTAKEEGGKKKPSSRSGPRMDMLRDGRARLHEVDIDGDGLLDYLVASGQVVRVYFGGADGADFSRPHLARRFSSELQGVGSFDIDGDGKLDLVALKFERPSIPRLIAAYFIPMSLDLEILGYLNQGGRSLSRRPDRKRILTVNLPAIRTVIEDFEAVADRFLAAVASQDRYRAADIDGDGHRDAAFVDDDDRLRIYFGRSGQPKIPTSVELGDLFFHPDKREWNLEELLQFIGGCGVHGGAGAGRRSTGGRRGPAGEWVHRPAASVDRPAGYRRRWNARRDPEDEGCTSETGALPRVMRRSRVQRAQATTRPTARTACSMIRSPVSTTRVRHTRLAGQKHSSSSARARSYAAPPGRP